MKKNIGILSLIFLYIALIVWGLTANPLSGNTTVGSWEWRAKTPKTDTCMIDTNGSFDTLAGETDSSDVVTKINFKDGWEYVLTHDLLTGSTDESVAVEVRIYTYDENENLLFVNTIDSITDSAGQQIAIPNGSEFGGGSMFTHSIRLFTYTGHGSQVILNRLYLHKRKWHLISPTSNLAY